MPQTTWCIRVGGWNGSAVRRCDLSVWKILCFSPQLLFETLSEQGKICSVNLVFILTLMCYISASARIRAERSFMLTQNTSLPWAKHIWVVQSAIFFFCESLFYNTKFLKGFGELSSLFWLLPTVWSQNLFAGLSQYMRWLPCADCVVAGLCVEHCICIHPEVM